MKRKILILLIAIPILFLSACDCENELTREGMEQQEKLRENLTEGNTNTVNYNVNEASNVNTQINLGPPKITDIWYEQLHAYYGSLPHRYSLEARGTYNNFPIYDNLVYNWSIDCGYFWQDGKNMGQSLQNDQTVEWRYDKAGECIEAKATVHAFDPEALVDDESNVFTKKLFEE